MLDFEDPRRQDHIPYLKHRIKMTKKKTRSIEARLFSYINETSKLSIVMDNFVDFFANYGTEETGETGMMLRIFARIFKQANGHRKMRQKMLTIVGANLRHVTRVYRSARDALTEYKDSCRKMKSARKRYVTTKSLLKKGRTVRKAKDLAARTESELFEKKGQLKKQIDEFDKELRKALMNFFFQFVKCEMFMAARVLETYSECYSKLDRWSKEIKEMKEWVVNHKIIDQGAQTGH